jgi:mRNA interferase RelE/StbE
MASYRIEVSATAEKQIRKLGRDDQLRVLRAIRQLGLEPHPAGSRKLHGYDDVFRIRVGTYRVLYSVISGVLVVIVLKVGHRKDVYR